jgi:tetratricopeptide (TPR) repeat protein
MSSVLANTAFGDEPGLWPLPAAATPRELWLRAVAAGGQGQYGAAIADLDVLCRLQRGGPLRSLAHSTRASFLRQLGWHDRARRWDGLALTLAGGDDEAGADALIGLAADALGVGRFAASAAALRRAGERLTPQAPRRLPVRVAWVTAELAMARGDGEAAVPHAERAVELAAGLGSARHTVKSDVIRAAALCSAGDIDASRSVADIALQEADRLGIIPLRWALACLLADIGSHGHTAADVLRIRNECAATVRRRGGDLAER